MISYDLKISFEKLSEDQIEKINDFLIKEFLVNRITKMEKLPLGIEDAEVK